MARDGEDGTVRRGNPWRLVVWGTAALLLLLPLVAMQFTQEVAWTPSDFIVFGVLLLVACGTYELGAALSRSTAYRAAVGLSVAGGFLLVWVNLAVGIIGTEHDPANLMFGGVLLVGAVGALLARFQPLGMARALGATALAQALVALIALGTGSGLEAAALSAFFAALWLASAWLFRRAAREASGA